MLDLKSKKEKSKDRVDLGLVWIDAEEPLDLFFFVAAVTTRVDTDGGEFAAFAPALESEGGDAQEIGDFADS